jgi:AAA family ATP:ADP antiporter
MDKRSAKGYGENGPVMRLMRRIITVQPNEIQALGWSWIYIFSLLMSYYIMRPIRDDMAIAAGIQNLAWLFTATLVTMILLNVPFGALVRALPRASFIAITYRFFTANILLFALAIWFADGQQAIWLGRAFFIWLSTFNLFVVSVFWALVVDVFDTEQGRRLFGFIAAGASLGAIFGSAVVVGLARHVPVTALLIAAAALLEIAVFGAKRLSAHAKAMRREEKIIAEQKVGGSVLAGFTHTFSSPYLFNTALFLLLFSMTSTFLYFEQASTASDRFKERASRTEFFATIDLMVNVFTLATQLFLTGRVLRLLGISLTLALLPALSVIGFGVLAIAPSAAALTMMQVARRVGNYAIARPTREILFTVVSREDRYKAKGFGDTVLYRVGDQLGAWLTEFFRVYQISHVQAALIALPLSIIWVLNSLWLGRRRAEIGGKVPGSDHPSPGTP